MISDTPLEAAVIDKVPKKATRTVSASFSKVNLYIGPV